MPGPILDAACPCGFRSSVDPGSIWVRDHLESRVIVYDPDKNDLVTVEGGEAQRRKLKIYPDPYITGELDKLFPCPSCGKKTMRFRHCGFWD